MSRDFFKTRENLSRLELDSPPFHMKVNSRHLWNYSGLLIKPDELYRIKAKENQYWTDFFVRSDTEGFASFRSYMKRAEKFRRHRPSNWMALIGCINHKYDFLIGKEIEYRPIGEGELIFYANGSIDWYWTHWGKIEITIERLK